MLNVASLVRKGLPSLLLFKDDHVRVPLQPNGQISETQDIRIHEFSIHNNSSAFFNVTSFLGKIIKVKLTVETGL